MTRWEKTKKWAKANAEPLAVIATSGAMIGLFVAAIRSDLKRQQRNIIAYNEWADDMNTWINDEREAGNAIYPLVDGTYLVGPETSNLKVVNK